MCSRDRTGILQPQSEPHPFQRRSLRDLESTLEAETLWQSSCLSGSDETQCQAGQMANPE